MAVIKNNKTGMWEVRTYYKDLTGERKQKTKRGFAKKSEALEWERNFKLKEAQSISMSFKSFVDIYLTDLEPRIKRNTFLTKKHIIETITIDQLGKIQPDTRNPVLASALETLGITENRYSGILTIRMEMEKYNLRQPEFLDERGSFIVKLYKESKNDYEDMSNDEETNNLIVFCKTPRTRKEICDYLGLNSVTYAIQTYVNPLVEAGVIKLSIPDKPKSPKQLYYSVEREE